MAIQIIGYGGVIADVDGTTYRALKVVQRPVEYGLRGSYRLAVSTGTIGGTALTNGSIFQFYWSSPTAIALLWGLSFDYSGSSSVAVTQPITMTVARSVTAFGTGGTSIVVPGTSGQSQQLRTSMRPSLASPVLVATTAALTNGTWKLDNNAMGSFLLDVDASGANKIIATQIKLYGNMSHRVRDPICLLQNEALNVAITNPTTSTYVVGLAIAWSEVIYY